MALQLVLQGMLTPAVRPVPSGHNAHMSPIGFAAAQAASASQPLVMRMQPGWLKKA